MIWRAVLKKELISGLRDRRALLSALMMPIVGPVMLVVMIGFMTQLAAGHTELSVAVAGAANAPFLVDHLEQSDVAITRVDEGARDAPEETLKSLEVPALLVIPPRFLDKVREGRVAELELYSDSQNKTASGKVRGLSGVIAQYAGQLASLRLIARGVHPELAQPVIVKEVDLATDGEVVASTILGIIPLFLLMAAFVGGMASAIDTTAGERERRSLEPLLITPVSRLELAVGKWLAVSVISGLAVALSLVGFFIAVRVADVDALPFALTLTVESALLMALLLVPTTLLSSALMLFAASYSTSFKEAQSQTTVLIFLPMVPGIIGALYGLGDKLAFAPVPYLGQQMVLGGLTSGNTPWASIALSVVTTSVLSVLVLYFVKRRLESEKIL